MRQGRFIISAAAAVAALAIGPASALATPGSFTDDNYADFAAGHVTNAWTVEPGEVRLLRTTALGTTNFDAMPTDWATKPWPGGGTGTVSGGTLTVDGAAVHDGNDHGTFQQQTLEFRATFSGDDSQNVGLGDTFDDGPWAMFSTGPVNGVNGFYARTRALGSPDDPHALPANIDPKVSHLYRIDWKSTGVSFYVDGVDVWDSPDVIPDITTNPISMRPIASDFTPGGGSVKVDWFNLGAYPASGSFESRVFDTGTDPDVTWGSLIASAASGAPVMETRTGNTPNPNDGTWTPYQGLSGNVITSPRGRYIQYRTTGLTEARPSLEKVTIQYNVDTSTPVAGSGGSGGSSSGGGGGSSSGGNSKADKTAPKVTLVVKSLKVSKKGTVSFTVGCPATEASCKITLKLKNGAKTVASRTVTVKGGKTKTVTLQLDRATRQQLKHRSLKLSSVLSATDAAGNKRTTTKRVTLRG